MNEIMQKMLDLRVALQSSKNVSLITAMRTLIETQKIVSLPVEGCMPDEGEIPSKDAIRTYTLAMIVETAEFLQTLDWKPWKSKTKLDREQIIDEFADILAFMGIILHYLDLFGIKPEDLADGYSKKSIENIDRFIGNKKIEYVQKSLFVEE